MVLGNNFYMLFKNVLPETINGVVIMVQLQLMTNQVANEGLLSQLDQIFSFVNGCIIGYPNDW